MSGSVTRSGDGWQYVIDAGLDANGRRRQHRRRMQARLEPAGFTNCRTCLTLNVLPRFGHVQLAALTPLTLSSLYADLLKAAAAVAARCRTPPCGWCTASSARRSTTRSSGDC